MILLTGMRFLVAIAVGIAALAVFLVQGMFQEDSLPQDASGSSFVACFDADGTFNSLSFLKYRNQLRRASHNQYENN
jgi:FlaG/FlaF family flagellin (archaellin)